MGTDRTLKDTEGKKRYIISVISNKGGVGKTSIAVSLAFCFANDLGKTLLLELDSSPGDMETLFDIGSDCSLEVAIRFPENYKKNVKNVCRNLDVLKGFSNPIVAENVKPEATGKLIEFIKKDYPYIIIDTQTVINGIILDLLRTSNIILIITDYSIESISRISKFLDMLINKFSLPVDHFNLIVNKKKLFDLFRIWDISKILDFPISGFIPFDRKFSKSNFMLNRRKIFKSKFFKETRKILEGAIRHGAGRKAE
ncbi:MAG: AAA family ATPase [Actinomycetota bacterium]